MEVLWKLVNRSVLLNSKTVNKNGCYLPHIGKMYCRAVKSLKNYNGGFKMNKSDLIQAVAEKSGLTKKDSASAVDAIFDSISDSLASGDKVQLAGFGTFEV